MEINYKVYCDAARQLLPVKCDDDCIMVDTKYAATITVDDFEELLKILPEQYRVDGEIAFMINSRTDLILRELKNGKGEYIWQPPERGFNMKTYESFQPIPYSKLMDMPIIINEHLQDVPVPGHSAIIAAVVNLKALLEDGDFDGMVLLRVPK